jgi:carbamoyltransferase
LNGGGWKRAPGVPEMSYAYAYWRDALEYVRFDYVFAGLQQFTEDFVSAWIKYWLQKTSRRKLRLSGGVFMNVKMNKVIGELSEVDDMYIFPSCGDETNAIGAAWAYFEDQGMAEKIEPLGPFYLGVAPTDPDFDRGADEARKAGYRVEQPGDLAEDVASLLASGEVVARVDGREEFGARALGNRSILADPSRRDVVPVINKAIKSRDFWMPFACSVLAEAKERYLNNPKNFDAPYMILTFDSLHTDEIIAGCHPEDRTVRPQIVQRDWNPGYHQILERFSQKTGRGALLNTSFNIHGEPIVSTPSAAVDVLNRSGLKHLILGKYLISKS